MPNSGNGRVVWKGLAALVGLLTPLLAFAIIIQACGSKSSGGTTFNNNGTNSNGGKDGGNLQNVPEGSTFTNNTPDGGFTNGPDAFYSNDAYFAMDPPPCVCPIDGGPMNCNVDASPGGTPMCPDDKNRQGCRCPMAGQTAACWPGLRVDRDVGDCKDGTTTCELQNETDLVWGPCVGAVLPEDSGTPAQECKCFSAGEWAIANVSPCSYTVNGMLGAVSTYLVGMTPTCPSESTPPPYSPPSQDWSTDTLNVDCAGNFNLCYTIKAGNSMAPSQSDCTVVQVCIDGQYAMKGIVQTLPPLPGWAGSDLACAQQFNTSGGYGEMTVQGKSIDCETVDNGDGGPRLFNLIPYCPNPPPPGCQNGSTGTF